MQRGRIIRDFLPELTTAELGATGDKVVWVIPRPMRLVGFSGIVSTLTALDATSAVVALDYTATGAGGSRTELTTITIGDAVAKGTEVEGSQATEPDVNLAAGDTITIEVKTAGTDGTSAAGTLIPVVWYEPIAGHGLGDN